MNWNTKTTISAIIALIIIAIVTGLPVFWISMAAVIVLAAPALLQDRLVQIIIGILVIGGLLWNPIIKTWGYISPTTAGKNFSVVEKEFGIFLRTEMRGDDLVSYEFLADQINVAENKFRNSIVPKLNPNSANYDTELDKLKNAHVYYESKHEQLRELFNITTTLDLFLLYFQLLLYIAIILAPFYIVRIWKTVIPEELKGFLWKLPAFMAVAALMQATIYFVMPTSWQETVRAYVQQIMTLNFSHNPIVAVEIAILILCIAIAVRSTFPKLKNWAILFLIIGLMSTLYMWTGFNPKNIWKVDFTQIDNGKEAIEKEVGKLFDDPVKPPTVQKTMAVKPVITAAVGRWNVPFMKKNGRKTLSATKVKGITLPAGHYRLNILSGKVEWNYNNSAKIWIEVKDGQELTLKSKAYLYAVDSTATFRVQKN